MLTANDVMTTEVVTVSPETLVPDVARLLHERGISGVPVVDPDGMVIGIVSEGDLIGHAGTIGEQRRSCGCGCSPVRMPWRATTPRPMPVPRRTS